MKYFIKKLYIVLIYIIILNLIFVNIGIATETKLNDNSESVTLSEPNNSNSESIKLPEINSESAILIESQTREYFI